MILVAGGTGFVGGAIVSELCKRGKKVAVLTRDPGRHKERFPNLNVALLKGDVRDPATLAGAMPGVEAVIGCQQFPNSPMEDRARRYTFEDIDAKGTENLVRAATLAGSVKRYVYLSGAGASPDADRHWFQMKWRAETAVRDSGFAFTIFRPSWVYGPEDRALNRFLRISRFLPFVPLIGNPGEQRLQPVFVEDVARAVAEALEKKAADGQTFEIGGPEVLTMSQVVRTALDVAGRKRALLPAPREVVKAAASLLRFVPGRPLTPDGVDFITMDALADGRQVEKKLGVRMTPLKEALAGYLGQRA